MALIEIDGLPFLNMVIFHGKLLNNQMVKWDFQWDYHLLHGIYPLVCDQT